MAEIVARPPDRLTSLIARFRVTAHVIDPKARCRDGKPLANLFAAREPFAISSCPPEIAVLMPQVAEGCRANLLLFPPGVPAVLADELAITKPEGLLAAHIDLGGQANPLQRGLPPVVHADADADEALNGVVGLMFEEIAAPRCGGGAVLDRLCEVLIIRLLRHAISRGVADVGLVAGLSHPGLMPAIVAMHDHPARAWKLEDLADVAGMSRTQFANTFRDVVGQPPMGYLTGWRLSIARQEIAGGAPVKVVAGRVGFASAEALSRAFSRTFGQPPRAFQP